MLESHQPMDDTPETPPETALETPPEAPAETPLGAPPEAPPEKPAGTPAEGRANPRRRRGHGGWGLRVTTGGIIFLIAIDLIVLGMLAWPLIRQLSALSQVTPSTTGSAPSRTASLPASPTPTLEPSTALPSSTSTLAPPYPSSVAVQTQGTVILSLQEGVHSHLFAYQPQSLPLTRLTRGAWDDVNPCPCPDGKRIVFASNRSGYWDLYMLDIPSAAITRLTDSPAYEGAPSLSPDGLWMAYEAYSGDQPAGLDIYIRPVSGSEAPIRLTENPSADYAPVWSPLGRQIAFVSDRSGVPQIWLADLDKTGEQRFRNLSQDLLSQDDHPAWSPDGHSLAWSAVKDGYHSVMVMKFGSGDQPDQPPRLIGSGDQPTWDPNGRLLLATLLTPNQTYLVAYPLDSSGIVIPPMRMPGSITGLVWSNATLPPVLPADLQEAAHVTPTPLWQPVITVVPGMPGGRQEVVPLKDVEAPYPMLNDLVNESFQALRSNLALSAGWDLLSTLENAYIPLTSSLDPGRTGDWLYTGRAFAFTPLPMNAGWIVVTREDFGQDTYWRVYIKARYQDGSVGMPLHNRPWDFSIRYSGDPHSYEQGGALAEAVPPGYWLDFTQMAAAYGWQRLPALLVWRSAYQEARFNEFALTEGMDWKTAMLEIYPPEALIIPTQLVPPTRTLTPTPRWFQSPTPTATPTFRPTWTPYMTETATSTETSTALPSPTQSPSSTPTPPASATPAPSSTRTP